MGEGESGGGGEWESGGTGEWRSGGVGEWGNVGISYSFFLQILFLDIVSPLVILKRITICWTRYEHNKRFYS